MTLTRFGLHFSSISYDDVEPADLFRRISDTTKAAEQSGFDCIWVPDHMHQNHNGGGPSTPMLEAYTLLGALAAATEAVRLGALVTAVMLRNPAFLAKTVTTLDIISGGRAILGIGAGWDGAEYASYGIDFPPVKDREDRLEEAVQICRQMMGGKQPNTYDGQHYELKEAWNSPLPIQPHVPILIGGGGEKRTLAAVARYADACNIGGEIPVIAHKLGVLKAHCDEIGRDFSEISKTSGMAPSEDLDELCRTVEERFEIGIEGVVLSGVGCPSPLTVEAWGTALHKAFGAR